MLVGYFLVFILCIMSYLVSLFFLMPSFSLLLFLVCILIHNTILFLFFHLFAEINLYFVCFFFLVADGTGMPGSQENNNNRVNL